MNFMRALYESVLLGYVMHFHSKGLFYPSELLGILYTHFSIKYELSVKQSHLIKTGI